MITSRQIAAVAREVRAASAFVPGATCLTQALSAQLLLARVRIHSTLHIGVARDPNARGIKAHAWLNAHGTTVTGGEEAGAFVALPSTDFFINRRGK